MITKFRGEYAFLSNFYPSKVVLYGFTYYTVEHAYQASKSSDEFERQFIRALVTPMEAKRAGNSRLHEFRSDWEDVKVDIMTDLVRQKFNISALGQLLIATDPIEIVEGNDWHDTFWGKCYCGKCKGEGCNHLGEILMEVREELICNQEEKHMVDAITQKDEK